MASFSFLGKNKRYYWLLFEYLLTALILVVVYFQIDFSKTLTLVSQADLKHLVLVVALAPIFYFIKILKWNTLVRLVSTENDLRSVTYSFFFGFLWGVVSPGRLGEFARIKGLKGDKYKLSTLVLFDRLLDLLVVLVLALISLAIIFEIHKPFLLVCAGVLVALYFIVPNHLSFLSKLIKSQNSFATKVKELFSLSLFLKLSLLIYLFFLTLIAYLVVIVQFVLIVGSFVQVPAAISLVVPVAQLANLLPITIGGFGVREGLFLVLTKSFDLAKEIVVNSSILWFVINFLIGLFGYFIFYPKKRA